MKGTGFVDVLIWPCVERLIGPIDGRRFLDIACGNGLYARRLSQAGADVVVVVADVAARVPVEVGVERRWRSRRGLELVLAACRDDGRIRVGPKSPMYPCYTAEAARTLCRFGLIEHEGVRRTAEYLLGATHESGRWRCSFSRFGKGPEHPVRESRSYAQRARRPPNRIPAFSTRCMNWSQRSVSTVRSLSSDRTEPLRGFGSVRGESPRSKLHGACSRSGRT